MLLHDFLNFIMSFSTDSTSSGRDVLACTHIITARALRSHLPCLPVCTSVCQSACLVPSLGPVLVRGAEVGAGLERLVLRLCPHITTADCSSGWLGFSAKTGITDPCRLPTFTAATSMFSQSELRRTRELKRCEVMCVI